MYVIIGSHFVPLEGKFLLTALVIVYIDCASNVLKCPLNNGVFIVQKLVAKLSNTSTMLFPPVKKTLSNLVEVFESLTTSFERWTRRCLVDI